MPHPSHPSPSAQNAGAREFVKQSSLYQEFLAEREEILRHKWLESERLGYDIGFERALLDWIRKHRDSWRAARRTNHSGNAGATRAPYAFKSSSSTAAAPEAGAGKSPAPPANGHAPRQAALDGPR